MDLRKVIITGVDQKHYIGDVDPTNFELLKDHEPVCLQNVWQLLVLDQHMPHGSQPGAVSLSRSYILMSIATAPGALKEFHLVPSSWVDPAVCGVQRHVEELISHVEKPKMKANSPNILPANAADLHALNLKNPHSKNN